LRLRQNQSGTTRLHRNRNQRNPRGFAQNKKGGEIQLGAKRGNTKAGKNATTPYGRACYGARARNSSAQDYRVRGADAFARTKRPACSKRRACSGCDRKIWSGRGPWSRTSAVASAEKRFLALVSQFG
jgi:hypothetical protein